MLKFSISNTNRQIIVTMVAISLIALGIGSFFAPSFSTYFVGILFGTGFSILKLLLLENTLKKSMEMTPERAINHTRLHYSLRYLLTGVVLFIAAKKENISLIGVIIGILVLRPATYIVSLKIKNN